MTGQKTAENGRIYLFDNLRFLLICLVVVGHCCVLFMEQYAVLSELQLFIYSFHMPVFMFVAGAFHKNERVVPKAVAYISIGFLLKVVFFLGNVLISEEEPFRVFYEDNVPWFMFVLAGYTVTSYVLRDIDRRFLLLTSTVIGCFAGYDQTVGGLLSMGHGFALYPFYLLGQMCDKQKLADVSRRPVLRAAGAAALLGWAALCFCRPELVRPLMVGFGPPYRAEIFPWGPVLRVLCYGVALLMGLSMLCVLPARRVPLVSAMGGRTLQIYFWHWPMVRGINALTGLGPLLCATGPGRAAWLLFAVALTFALGFWICGFPTEFILRAAGAHRKK